MKRLQGLIAATVVTGIVAVGMIGIGVNAASNTNSVAVSDSPAQTAQAAQAMAKAASDQTSTQIDQLQNLIKQYQSREQQYQTEIKSLSQKLSDANATADHQQILQACKSAASFNHARRRIFLRDR
jgi:peptidoglycan hydrolase CwlO-like protein